MLDLTSLQKSLQALERSLTVLSSAGTLSPDLRETVRAGVVQQFEVAYEQSWKFMQRWLRENCVAEEADHPRTRRELFRAAAQGGLIDQPHAWFEYGEARNLTAHTYDEKQATIACQMAERFLLDGKSFLQKLEAAND